MNNAAKKGLKQYEILDELRGLVQEYQNNINYHKMKHTHSSLEVAVTTTVSVAEDLVKFKWSDAVKSIFNISKQNIALLQDEKNSPGKEIAYIVKAQNKFN